MINKEIIFNADGTILKDFSDRNTPQYSHNEVCISCLIPTSCFSNMENYIVELGCQKIVGGEQANLYTLNLVQSKVLNIKGIDYVKFSVNLTLKYTNFVGVLKMTPYIKNYYDGEIVNIKSFSTSQLNVIKSVIEYREDLLDQTQYEYLLEQLNAKKILNIKTNYQVDDATELILDYMIENYASDFYNGYIFTINNFNTQYISYKSNGEFLLIDHATNLIVKKKRMES